jgi:flagellar biogenesis protein FliO
MPGSHAGQPTPGRPILRSGSHTRVIAVLGPGVLALLLLTVLPAAHLCSQDDGASAEGLTRTSASDHEAASGPQLDGARGKGEAGSDIAAVTVTGVLGRLALIAVLVYAVVWGLRQWRDRGVALPRSGRGGLIRVRESVSLGSAGRLYMVQFGTRSLLLSAVGDRVTLLTGNSASEMESLETCSIPPQSARESTDIGLDHVRPEQPEMDGHDINGACVRAEHRRRTSDWESRRDALVRALQSSVES